MAITGANGINSVYSNFQTRFLNSYAQSAGIDTSIFGSMTGSSGASLGSADMSSIMQMMMMIKMMESMGMDMSDITGSGSSSDDTTTTTTSTSTTTVNPSTSGITTNAKVGEKLVTTTTSRTVTDANGTQRNVIGGFTLGEDETYSLVQGIGLNGADWATNVFQHQDGKLYYYANGQLTEITDTSDGNGNMGNGDTIALNGAVYTVVEDGSSTVLRRAGSSDLTFEDLGSMSVNKINPATGDNVTGENGTVEQETVHIYKVGNATYELRHGVLVPRSTTLTAGGTINIIARGATNSDNNFGTVTAVAGKQLSEEFLVGTTKYTRTYTGQAGKKLDPSRIFYTADSKYYELSGATLTEVAQSDPSIYKGNNILSTNAGYKGLALAGNNVSEGQTGHVQYYTREENGVERLFRVVGDVVTDVTDEISVYTQLKVGGTVMGCSLNNNTLTITLSPGNTAELTHADDYKAGVYKATESLGSIVTGKFYKFTGGSLVEVSAPGEIYQTMNFGRNSAGNAAETIENASSLLTDADKANGYTSASFVDGDYMEDASSGLGASATQGNYFMQWNGSGQVIIKKENGDDDVAVERYTRVQAGTGNYYWQREIVINITKPGHTSEVWRTAPGKYDLVGNTFQKKTEPVSQ